MIKIKVFDPFFNAILYCFRLVLFLTSVMATVILQTEWRSPALTRSDIKFSIKYVEIIVLMTCQDHQCGLRLYNVSEADAGTWRCEVMSSSVSPLDSVISLMRQMEEYRLGDWVAGARHEAEVELVIRNKEEGIIFIDVDAEDTTIETNYVENIGRSNPDIRMNQSEMVDYD